MGSQSLVVGLHLSDEDRSFLAGMNSYLGQDQALDYAIGLLGRFVERDQNLEDALRRVLDWPLPFGVDGKPRDVETWAIPDWLAKRAHDALGDAPKERTHG